MKSIKIPFREIWELWNHFFGGKTGGKYSINLYGILKISQFKIEENY